MQYEQPADIAVPSRADRSLERLAALVDDSRRLLVLTGAGCSTACGIPDYRSADGSWKRREPVRYQAFLGSASVRRRYWARSLVGWRAVGAAEPGPPHEVLARLERAGFVHALITQNVDGLHRRAGSRALIDLHGRLDRVVCLSCRVRYARQAMQTELERLNPGWARLTADDAPDGDADLESMDFEAFAVPDCPACGGTLKPDVIFFGENVPRERTARAFARLDEADAVLVVGSSLMVWSGYRFVRAAVRDGKPAAAVTLGRTRADGELTGKLTEPCETALPRLAERLGA